MLKFANWWLFAVFAISRVVCGKKWRISKEIVKNTKTDLQNIRIVLFKTVFIFWITAFWNFAKKLGRYCTLMQLVLYILKGHNDNTGSYTCGHFIRNLWNVPKALFINFIWNDHSFKILYIWIFSMVVSEGEDHDIKILKTILRSNIFCHF